MQSQDKTKESGTYDHLRHEWFTMYLSSEAHVVIAAGLKKSPMTWRRTYGAVCQNGLVNVDKGVVYNVVVRFFEYYLEYLLKIHYLDCESPAFPWLRAKFNLTPFQVVGIDSSGFGTVWITFPPPLEALTPEHTGCQAAVGRERGERLRYLWDRLP